ncbi:hypothetical protein M102_gp41 [Streptococcus phage M102]|nr:hypothetical protein M102_gp41 [Streptococcus phage M102]CAO77391.1 hypothetical protein [Streptococcus phage M102]
MIFSTFLFHKKALLKSANLFLDFF